MHAIHLRPAGPRSGWAWGAPVEASAAILEVVASGQPELVEFQAQTLLNSTMSFAVRELASAFGVPPEKVGEEVARACNHLDRLERIRRTWQDPAEVLPKGGKWNDLDSPNLAALVYICGARLKRASPPTRQQRLERIQRRLEAAYKVARTRVWIDDFIGPLPAKPRKVEGDDR